GAPPAGRGPPALVRGPRAGPDRPDCFGIIAGLGRGRPGTLPGRPSRAAGGRGGIWPGPGRLACCIPWVDENGLLPGRGPAGLGAVGAGAAPAADAAGAATSAGGSATGMGCGSATGSAGTDSTRGADGRGPCA